MKCAPPGIPVNRAPAEREQLRGALSAIQWRGSFRPNLAPAARRGSGLHEQTKAGTRAKSLRDRQTGPIDPPLLIVARASLDSRRIAIPLNGLLFASSGIS